MAKFLLLSDEPMEKWAEFMQNTMVEMSKAKIERIAVVAMTEENARGKGEVLTGYYNMSLSDKQMAAAHIQADVTDGLVRANMRRYIQELKNEDDGWERE